MSKWWKNGIIYQIYPKSFKDSNGDGIGDIKGIISKLDYLKSLNVDGIWISPFYESPMEDNGYDVSDYYKISPEFGTMEDYDLLIQEAKKRDIKIIMDLVANHTSKEHYWFKEAIKSRDNYYHDFYIWRDKPDGKTSSFGGEAWEYVESVNQYYYHYFAKGQVDLNWENPNVRKEIAKMVNFWIDKGAAGFRLDAIELIGKEIENNIIANGPKIHEYLRELNELTFGRFEDSISVGEGWPTPEIALDYISDENKELNLMFQFETAALDWLPHPFGKFGKQKFDLVKLKSIFKKWQQALYNKGWNAIFYENHDLPRSISRYGNDNFYREECSKALALMYFMQQGTLFLYQGQEIGMTNTDYTELSDFNDVDTFQMRKYLVEDLKLISEYDVFERIKEGSRDNARTPMQWDDSNNAGFTTSNNPWLKVNKNYLKLNVKNQENDDNSILNFYRKLLYLRKNELYDITLNGYYDDYLSDDKNLCVYERSYNGKKILVCINYSESKNIIDLDVNVKKILISNYNDSKLSLKNVLLRPFEAILFEVE